MSASKELGSGSLNPANTLRKLKIKPRWFLPFLPLFLVLGSLPAVRVLSKLYNTDDTVPDDGGNNRNEPRKQPHHHPLSKENENITEADLLNRCCIWTHKQKVYASYSSGMCWYAVLGRVSMFYGEYRCVVPHAFCCSKF